MRFRLAVAFGLLASSVTYSADTVIFQPTLQNVDAVGRADLNAIVKELNQAKCTDLDELAERVRFAFQEYGYFKVQVADPVLPTAQEIAGKTVVPVPLAVTAGEKFRLRNIVFSSPATFPPSQLRATFPIKDGDIFNREKIALGLENLRKVYGHKGYIDFSAVPDTEIDDLEHTIGLRIDLDEGVLYYIGNLVVRGVESEPGARERLLTGWKKYQGQVYDWRILGQFLRDLHARPQVKPEQVFEVSEDPRDHVVNVYITLVRPIF